MNGFFNILKPTGMSSAAVVAVMRRLTGEKRVGHAGTLDPEAAGVLPIMTGKAARLFDYLTDKEKEYVAVCAFGSRTDTQDATGEVIETGDNYPDREIRQVPSMYSAIKVGGKPLYARARKGETVEVPERTVHIESIEVLRDMPEHGIEIRVRCGKGTYIRTLCEDLGNKCGCPAHMRSLLRTRSGVFTIDEAITLDEARTLAETGTLTERMLPPDWPLSHLLRTDMPARMSKRVINGAKIPLGGWISPALPEGGVTRIYLDNGYNVIIYDLRGHGMNSKTITTFTILEREDLYAMILDSRRRYPDMKVLGLHGESLGAGTTVAVLEKKPPVDFAVVDCGFYDMVPVFEVAIRSYHLPVFMVKVASMCAKVIYGYSFRQMRPIEALPDNQVPLLFMHGSCDELVSPEHSRKMSKATAGYSEVHMIPNAGHADAVFTDPEMYRIIVTDFLRKIVPDSGK